MKEQMKDGNRKDLLIAVVTAGLCTAAIESAKCGVWLAKDAYDRAKKKRRKAGKQK